MSKEFYMVLPSNSCPRTSPNNTANMFIVDYENPLRLTGKWRVALTEFSCIYSAVSMQENAVITFTKNEMKAIPFEIHFYRGNVSSTDALVEDFTITKTFENRIAFGYTKPFTVNFNTLHEANIFGFNTQSIKSVINQVIGTPMKDYTLMAWGTITFDESESVKSQIVFQENILFNNTDDLREYLLEHCSQVFKEIKFDQNNLMKFSLIDDIKELEFDSKICALLGFNLSKFINVKERFFKADEKPKLRTSFNHMYIYSSITEPLYVGSDRVPLLKNVWLENKQDYVYGDVVYLSIDHPMYLPVAVTDINKIEINIRDDSGTLINFSKGSVSSLTLHFRNDE